VTVEEFLAAEAALPAYPGACCRMVDRWFQQVKGYSALSRYGRDFLTDNDVRQWLSEPGGMAVAVNRVARAAGVPKTKTPQAGDVGLIIHDGRLCAAIHSGAMWVGRDEKGLFSAPQEAVWKAWSLR
jgi:hypothetical protein